MSSPATSSAANPVAVVTGASAGVGRATARALAHEGFDVAVIARGSVGLKAVATEIERLGRKAMTVAVDVADASGVERAIAEIEAGLGPIDVLVNNAMTTVFSPVERITPAEFERATRVTYLGQVHATMAVLPRMKARDHGVIVSVGSALAFRGIALQAPYCGAKFAVRGFHESVRTELRHQRSRVRIVQVHLPAVNTPQFSWCRNKMQRQPMPVAPIYAPEVAARAIVAAATRPRRQRIVGTWNWGLVQLSKLAPGIIDHFAARTTVDGQQTEEPANAGSPDNLDHPLDGDDGTDRGATGEFVERSDGVLDPSFIRTLPETVANVVRSLVDRIREVGSDWTARVDTRGSTRVR